MKKTSSTATTARSGAQCVLDFLETSNCDVLFGYPGGAVLDIFDQLMQSEKVQLILVRHEQGATHMADGYARATGRCGFCLVTSGPGATNAVTGLATAYMDGIPMVCISGQVPTAMIGNDAFQEADTVGITRGITKHNYLVRNVDDLPRVLAEALHIATTGKPGPVLVDIPKDVQKATTAAPDPAEIDLRGYKPSYEGHPRMVARLAEAINASRRPLFYVGGGAISAGASDLLTAVARKGGIPVTTTLLGLGSFPETDPLALRMLGMHGSVAANNAVNHCDLLVSVGARFDDRVTGKVSEWARQAKVAHIDIDPASISKSVRADIPVVGHLKPILEQLLPMVEPRDRTEWHALLDEWKTKWPFGFIRHEGVIPAQYVVEQAYLVSKGRAVVATDVGQHQMFAAQFFKYTRPRTFLSSGGLGTMGFGLPAAIGAQLGRPDDLVICIAGDGGAQMCFQELVVAVEHQLPVKMLILNNGYLGMVRQWQEIFYRRGYSGVALTQCGRAPNERIPEAADGPRYLPDFVKLAEAHGACARRVERFEDVAPTLTEAFASPKTWVLEFIVESEGNVLPMVPPGGSNADIITKLV